MEQTHAQNRREIRFRAWDVNKKQWVADGVPMDLNYSGKANCFMFDNDAFDIPKNVIWLQFTGLKDKKGKEICEGDIVLADDYGEYFPQKYVEEKDEYVSIGKYKVVWDKDIHGWGIRELNGKRVDLELVPFCMEVEWEVLGNIYEHKELLA